MFKDDDGQFYMYYGGWRHCNIVKLSDDLLSLVPFEDGETFKEVTPDKYVEGPFVFKQSVYEGGLRVPFVISWPDKLKPEVCDELVISFDVLPTVCAALGIELSDNLIYDGKNILPIINRSKNKKYEPLHEQLFFDGNDGSWAVREGDWKLLHSREKITELYNLKDDLGEMNNLAEQEPKKVADLKSKYTAWRYEMATPMGSEEKRNKN